MSARRVQVPIDEFVAVLRGEPGYVPAYADGAGNATAGPGPGSGSGSGAGKAAGSFAFLQADISPPPPCVQACGAQLLHKRTDVWIGRSSISSLHFDNCENLFAQVRVQYILISSPRFRPSPAPLLPAKTQCTNTNHSTRGEFNRELR